MGSENSNADIDDVLKESQALLDRLQSKSSNSITNNDAYDGGASLASLGSQSLRDAASMLVSVADSSRVEDDESGVADSSASATRIPSSPVPASSATIKQSVVQSEAPPASHQARPPLQWEKAHAT